MTSDKYTDENGHINAEGFRRCLAEDLGLAYKPCDLASTARPKLCEDSSCSTCEEGAVMSMLESVIEAEDDQQCMNNHSKKLDSQEVSGTQKKLPPVYYPRNAAPGLCFYARSDWLWNMMIKDPQ